MKKQIKKKVIPYLDYACHVGERVQWTNLKGEKLEGKLIEMDNEYLASIELDNGTIVQYQC